MAALQPIFFESKPDTNKAIQRMEAWWEGEILDRPPVQITAPRKDRRPLPTQNHATLRERWMDVDFNLDRAEAQIANTAWIGEILPNYHPNLGPDFMAALFGSPLEFAADTSWSAPILQDWSAIDGLNLQFDSRYFETLLAMTRAACQRAPGKFLVGHTDLHPAGDLCAALRGPQQFCLDVIESPLEVEALMRRIEPAFYLVYEAQHAILRAAGQSLTTTWLPAFAPGRYYVPSNDFSCMVSPQMFERFFAAEIEREVAWLDRSIYHLDGPQALPHLDRLLAMPRLDAIQFVYGAGAGPASRWLDVYRKIQAAGKSLHVYVDPEDLGAFIGGIAPPGVLISTHAESEEHAAALLAQVEKWTA
ncbi:MAG: hypothetical protein ACREJ2_16450 [Planctomycetota bacterium]